MSVLEQNLSVIRQRWPAVSDAMVAAPDIGNVALDDTARQATLVIDGIHLSSRYDRLREAELQASLVPADSAAAWVYGIGLGDVPRALLSREPIRELHVTTLNPAVARQCFAHFDQSDWLQDPRVELAAADEQSELHRPFAAVTPCLQLADDRASRLRDLIVLELATPFIHEKHSTANPELVERLKQNVRFVEADGDAKSLFGGMKGGTIVLAAAGPTLSDHYDWLRRAGSGVRLIAVDSALKPLLAAGIQAHFVVSIDMVVENVTRFFRDLPADAFRTVPLIYFPSVPGEALDLWPGPRLAAYPDNEAYRELANRFPKATLYASGSVLHPAVDLAVRMGAKRIVLLGADFSFPGGTSHVRGSAITREAPTTGDWVLDGEGRRVPTQPNFRGFLRDLERYIAVHPQVQFVNGSKRGAQIKGAPYAENLP